MSASVSSGFGKSNSLSQTVSRYVFDKQAHDAHDHQCIEGSAFQTTQNGNRKPLEQMFDLFEIVCFRSQLNIPLLQSFTPPPRPSGAPAITQVRTPISGTGCGPQLSPFQTPSSVQFTTPRAIPGPTACPAVQSSFRPRVLFQNSDSPVQPAANNDGTGTDTQQTQQIQPNSEQNTQQIQQPSNDERIGVRNFIHGQASQASSSTQTVVPAASDVQQDDSSVRSNLDFTSLMTSTCQAPKQMLISTL